MEINFERKIKKKLENEKTIKKEFGKLADKILIRLSLLCNADNLGQIPNISPTRRHKLIGNYKECWGIEIEKNWKIVIKSTTDNQSEPNSITNITIVDIVDYH